MKRKFFPVLVLTAAACMAGATAEAMAPEAQIEAVLNLPAPYGDELQKRLSEDGIFAVTDLDGNGQLELFFQQDIIGGFPKEGEGAEGEKEQSAWKCIQSIPVSRKIWGYEISAGGNRLYPIAVAYTDEEIEPNLQGMSHQGQNVFWDSRQGAIVYCTSTLLRVGDRGYRLAAQAVSLNNGTLNVQTLASEYGNYAVYAEQGTPEAVASYISDRYGNRCENGSLADAAGTYSAGPGERFRASIRWNPVQILREADSEPGGRKDLLLESWNGFHREPVK